MENYELDAKGAIDHGGVVMTEIRLPFISPEIEGGRFLHWLIKEGQRVEIDQDLGELDLENERFILPSPLDGVVRAFCVAEDEWVSVGDVLALFEEE
jgi:pyruvate/2-oxoglutarate dehydrogenase complex dihydrolipoamide acyltransferase (E2) component